MIFLYFLVLVIAFLISFFPAVPLDIQNSSLYHEAASPLGLHRLYSNNI